MTWLHGIFSRLKASWFSPARYRHFKGGTYLLWGEATLEADQSPAMVYTHEGESQVWIRAKSSWQEPVEWPDGVLRPRFCRLGPDGQLES